MGKHKKLYLATLLSYIAAGGLFLMFSPEKLPVSLLLLPFFIIFTMIYLTFISLATVLLRQTSSFHRTIILVVSSLIVLLLLIQTVTQLTVRDVVLTLSILVILSWYLTKTKPAPKNK